jgi:lipopolysaccharide/colanic/teichoic acid biosynthesis glycosyltransferase
MKRVSTFCEWVIKETPYTSTYGQMEIFVGTMLMPAFAIVSLLVHLPVFLVIACWYKLITFTALFVIHAFRMSKSQGEFLQDTFIFLHLIDVPLFNYFGRIVFV